MLIHLLYSLVQDILILHNNIKMYYQFNDIYQDNYQILLYHFQVIQNIKIIFQVHYLFSLLYFIFHHHLFYIAIMQHIILQ